MSCYCSHVCIVPIAILSIDKPRHLTASSPKKHRMISVPTLILSLIGSSFAQTSSYYAVYNSIFDTCGNTPSTNTSDFGCGPGLECRYQNERFSECLPDKAFAASAFLERCNQPDLVGTGIKGSCALGTFCMAQNDGSADCRPCRTQRVTCVPNTANALNQNVVDCCPGIFP